MNDPATSSVGSSRAFRNRWNGLPSVRNTARSSFGALQAAIGSTIERPTAPARTNCSHCLLRGSDTHDVCSMDSDVQRRAIARRHIAAASTYQDGLSPITGSEAFSVPCRLDLGTP